MILALQKKRKINIWKFGIKQDYYDKSKKIDFYQIHKNWPSSTIVCRLIPFHSIDF